eukprot:5928701-Prymnesium_polylepis.1
MVASPAIVASEQVEEKSQDTCTSSCAPPNAGSSRRIGSNRQAFILCDFGCEKSALPRSRAETQNHRILARVLAPARAMLRRRQSLPSWWLR